MTPPRSTNSPLLSALVLSQWSAIDAALDRLDPRTLCRLYDWARVGGVEEIPPSTLWSLSLRCLKRLRPDWRQRLARRCDRALGLTMLIDLALSGPMESFELRWRELDRGANDPVAVGLGYAAQVYTYTDSNDSELSTMSDLKATTRQMLSRGALCTHRAGLSLGPQLPTLPAAFDR